MTLILALSFFSFAGMAPSAVTHFTDVAKVDESKNLSAIHAANTWSEFIKCGTQKDIEKKFENCIQNSVSKSSNKLKIGKFAEFLLLGLEVSGLEDCSSQQKKFIEQTGEKNYRCFRIFGKKTARVGVVYFQLEQEAAKIISVTY